MNYRHHFHAGNYADVFKHVILRLLLRGLQRKEKGFLYLDTHAGRGAYDLTVAPARPDGREREPEWPAGIGRLWARTDLPGALGEYVGWLREFTAARGEMAGGPGHYPGSPWIARACARPQDRLVLCELREDEAEALAHEFWADPQVRVERQDGYGALKALLPPPERRALVLIDPPFEDKGEFDAVLQGLRAALRRLPGGTYAVWYPITERARSETFHQEIAGLGGVPALVVELEVAAQAAVRMKGCGLLILNPPWRIEDELKPLLPVLAGLLQAGPGATARSAWLVPES